MLHSRSDILSCHETLFTFKIWRVDCANGEHTGSKGCMCARLSVQWKMSDIAGNFYSRAGTGGIGWDDGAPVECFRACFEADNVLITEAKALLNGVKPAVRLAPWSRSLLMEDFFYLDSHCGSNRLFCFIDKWWTVHPTMVMVPSKWVPDRLADKGR